ncbi:hypothetical protein NN858_005354 [Escherichia coli]|nr:hypothetical protein [Escherichia coli]EKM2120557.1 hypothetical protein [Escherichia coli O26]EEX6113310.1 hypothetical protein [Escherichia coli]EEY0177373.1 hypothetical protein [Escherichia coli]EFE0421661.1 hypothetical protein [Escherichia coli]
MSFTDNWSDEEFIRQMKELIGNEGDIHVTCNHSEGEQVTEAHVPQKALWYRHNGDREGMRVCLNLSRVEVLNQRYFLGPCPF